jgi:hypothetical protein
MHKIICGDFFAGSIFDWWRVIGKPMPKAARF